METTVQKQSFLKAVAQVSSVTSSRTNTLPILENILIETRGEDQLFLMGTDLEILITATTPAKVQKEGSITIPAKKLHDIIKELPEGEIEIVVAKNNAVNIKSNKAYFKIMGLSKDDYPKFPDVNQEDIIEIEQSLIKNSLSLTIFAISRDETRYVLNGVLISIKENHIRFVATDGRRLAFIDKELPKNTSKDFEMILPTKAAQELLKLLSWEGTVQITPLQNQVLFRFGDTHLISRLIEGHFPNYEQVIPKEEKTVTVADREEFLQAVRRASLLTSTEAPAVKLDFVKGKILVSSRSPNLGEAKEELPAEVTGGELAIGFNPNYLIDVLKNLDIDQISLSLTDADKPGLLKGKDGYLYVIMPMQLH